MPTREPPERPATAPYRAPETRRPAAPEPDVDPALLRTQWWDPLLTLSVLVVPAALALTWLGQLTVRYGSGPAHPETVAEKLATTLAFGFALVILLGFRARHRRRQRAALQEIRAYEEAEAARRRADDS